MKVINFFKKSLKYILVLCVAMLTAFQFIVVKSGETKAEVIEREVRAQLTAEFSTDENNNFLIQSASDLVELSKMKTTSSTKFKQTCNIDLQNQEFTPIGSTYPFSGVYDGCGYSISNLKINTTNSACSGLFAQITNGTLKNIIIKSGSVKQRTAVEDVYAGALVGYAAGAPTITQCYNLGCTVNASSTTGKGYSTVGGLIGYAESPKEISGLYNMASVNANGYNPICGGIIGGIDGLIGDGIKNCQNMGEIIAGNNASTMYSLCGGIAGTTFVDILDSYNGGTIRARAKSIEDITQDWRDVVSPNTVDISKNPQINQFNNGKEGYILIWVREKIKQISRNGFAGGIAGRFYLNSHAINCINSTTDISGGVTTYEVEHSLRNGVNDQYLLSTYWWYSEHYNLTTTKTVANRYYIGLTDDGVEHEGCFQPEVQVDNEPTMKLTGVAKRYDNKFVDANALDKCYHETDENSYTDRNILSAIKNGKITTSFTEYPENNTVSVSSKMNYLKFALLYNLSDLGKEEYPIKDDVYTASITTSTEGYTIKIDYSFNYASSLSALFGAIPTTYKSHSISYDDYVIPKGRLYDISIITATESQLPAGLDSDIWGLDPNLNGGYPYLKDFYWQHNYEEPTN